MHLLETKVAHEANTWRVDFVGDDGEEVSIKIADRYARDGSEALHQAKELMVQLTPFGTRGSGAAVNLYDAARNGTSMKTSFPDGTDSQSNALTVSPEPLLPFEVIARAKLQAWQAFNDVDRLDRKNFPSIQTGYGFRERFEHPGRVQSFDDKVAGYLGKGILGSPGNLSRCT